MIRRALPADAAALAELAERSFRDAFATMNAASDMDLHCLRHYGEPIQAREIGEAGRVTLVAEDGGALSAFAQLRWGASPACVTGEAPGEIQRFYLARDFHGSGLAAALMQACFETLYAGGARTAWLGVWERNARAIAFYRRLGFLEQGEQRFLLGTDLQRDLVLARPLHRPLLPRPSGDAA
jgi:ribosomal protein S18 acetylase RimI-like enzyme